VRSAVAAALLAAPLLAAAAGGGAHGDPVAPVLLEAAVVLVAAKLGGELAARAGQPAVLGELLAGVVLGNLHLAGLGVPGGIAGEPGTDLLARIGVVLLLFQVGVDSTVGEMARVGFSALLVAIIGVAVPLALGFGVGAWLLPERDHHVHAFLGATLAATSVGITARVLRDLHRDGTPEARIVLGAAVVDDILGLVVLAVISGLIAATSSGTGLRVVDVGLVVAKALVFLAGAIAVGLLVSRRLYHLAARLRSTGLLLPLALSSCFVLAWLADLAGLAPIVGAFAAGLVFEEAHSHPLREKGEHPLKEQLEPVIAFLAPVFFVLMGMRTDLRAFGDPAVLGLAAALTIAAVAGKLSAGLGAPRGLDRLSIGIGMIPRGEVGLIFANVGLSLTLAGERVIDGAVYGAVVAMVIATTLATPPALRWSLARGARRGAS
jgi:Kef-type K+ transport system membrane component KefB